MRDTAKDFDAVRAHLSFLETRQADVTVHRNNTALDRKSPGLFLQTRACLEELMKSDEDMLGLLLTEAKDLGEGEVSSESI